MRRMTWRASNLCLTKSSASASSKPGCDAGLVARKSSGGSTRPRPIRCDQMRLAWTRANKVLVGLVSQVASALSGSPSRSIPEL